MMVLDTNFDYIFNMCKSKLIEKGMFPRKKTNQNVGQKSKQKSTISARKKCGGCCEYSIQFRSIIGWVFPRNRLNTKNYDKIHGPKVTPACSGTEQIAFLQQRLQLTYSRKRSGSHFGAIMNPFCSGYAQSSSPINKGSLSPQNDSMVLVFCRNRIPIVDDDLQNIGQNNHQKKTWG